jgi:hypothetical protein
MSKDGQERLLGRLVQAAKQGVNYHPRDRELRQLATDLEREYLMVAVPENKRPKER